VLDSRLHRVALVLLVVPALVLTAFSLKPSILPRTTALAPDAFDGVSARADLAALAQIPDRSPGSRGDAAAAAFVARRLKSAGFIVTTKRADAETLAGRKSTVVVTASRTGFSQRGVVVVADRASRSHGTDSLTGTAVLLEMARAVAGRTLAHSVEFVSTGAGPGGALAGWKPKEDPGSVVGVVVLGELAGSGTKRMVVPWAQLRGTAAPGALERSVDAAVQTETGLKLARSGLLERLARLSIPITTTGQGALVADGVPAIELGSSGELDSSSNTVLGPRFEGFGRAALRVAGILDGADRGWPGANSSALPLRDRELPPWTMRLIAGMALLAALITGIDAMARSRRQRIAVVVPGVWLLASWPAMLLGWLWLLLAAATGVIDGVPAVTAPVGSVQISWAALAGIPVAVALGWLVLRPLALRTPRGIAEAGPGAPAALMLISAVAGSVVWIRDPLTALLIVPFIHIAPWLVDPARAPSRRACAVLIAVTLIPTAVVLTVIASDLGAGPISLGWTLVLIFASGSVGPQVGVITTLLFALLASTVLLAVRPRSNPELELQTRGPLGYAGPGSLGGTN